MGLLSELTSRENLEARTLEVAREVCRVSPVAARESKEAIDAAMGTPLEQGMEIEQMAWRRVISSQDRAEGISAFNEKRDPNWTNRLTPKPRMSSACARSVPAMGSRARRPTFPPLRRFG
jgi:1,4-dihydroxy-2-naphthoyl-CoA synthase